jgi:tetratricopeptide (TPR) repeat protein
LAKLTRKEKLQLQKQDVKPTAAQQKKQKKGVSSLRRMLAIIVALTGFVLYANTFGNDYVLDDFGLIKDNTQTKKGISAIPQIFKSSYRFGMNITDYQLYRPLTKAMFAAEWSISPNSPGLGHFVNVVCFALLCYLLFIVLTRYLNGNLIIPFITTLLFAAHPLHTEVVANIKSRDEIMCLLLILGSLYFYYTYVTTESKRALLSGTLCYFAALFSKESAITFLAITPLMFYFFTNANSKKYYATVGGMVVCTVIFLLIRRSVLGSITSLIPVEDNSLAGIKDIVLQKANAIYLLGVYMYKMIIPTPLFADASYNTFPPVSLSSWKFFVPFAVCLAGAIYALMNFRKKDIISFCILFFFITVSIVSNVVILIGTNYGERLMFVPSLGICMLFAVLISRIIKREETQQVAQDVKNFFAQNSKAIVITLGIVVLFSVKTLARNTVWKDNITLYTTDVQNVPNSAHMLFYLANHITNDEYLADLPDSLSREKARQEAMGYLTRAVTIFPRYADGYQRRGFIYTQMGDSVKAEADYKRALEINPTHPIVYNNYGTLCFNQHRYEEAFRHFENAVKYNPNYAHALNNLASVYGVFGQSESEAIARDPANKEEHMARARQNFETALVFFNRSIKADPDFGEPYRLGAITYRNIGDQIDGDKYDAMYREVMQRTGGKASSQ